jgi:hypothetical protein
VEGRPEGGYTSLFEVICGECGDDPGLDYSGVPPRLHLVRGPYALEAGLSAYDNHLWLHTQPGAAQRPGTMTDAA